MHTFPKIETPRLLLSALKAADLPQIVQHASNRQVSRYTMSLPYPYTEADALGLIHKAYHGFQDNNRYLFGIRLKAGQLIGVVGLQLEKAFKRAELNFWIGEPYWGKGLTTEAVRAAVHYGFSHLGLRKVTSTYMALNPASGKVMENCGMKREGELAEHVCKAGIFYDIVLYGLVIKDYQGLANSADAKVII
ncbi:RimJ/RimL family protein N-acetyltransferase [Mucilaginibacter gracilis]|uniref:RimJ/RimL family protein N-acetyltransferase n=1 Tax=Mucilaginibacter gracilis TaxID=423350 RepID=A0A495J274_9SPHI|nr:GNAT family N-acetyltransferase [Mucilaginibacter gracilis]RKR82129.1 RimJ/RimL family protein N-acetyltransferase [Mucilaginibacter gracilis]